MLQKKSWTWPILILYCIYKKTKICYCTIPPASVLLPTTTWSTRKSGRSILFCEFKISFCGNGSKSLSFRPQLMLKIPNSFLSFLGCDTSWGQLTFLVNRHLLFKVCIYIYILRLVEEKNENGLLIELIQFFVERMKLKVSSGGHSCVESDRDIDSSWENPSGVLADL